MSITDVKHSSRSFLNAVDGYATRTWWRKLSFLLDGRHTYCQINSSSAGIDFSRQNLSSKVDPRTEMIEYL